MQEQKEEKEMSESEKASGMERESENKGYGRFILGIPCKYSEIAIIPKYIYEFFDWGETAKCRGGELVTLELMKDYSNEGSDGNASTEQIEADLSAMYGIDIVEYTQIWKQRLDALNSREIEWVKVAMRKIENKEGEKA